MLSVRFRNTIVMTAWTLSLLFLISERASPQSPSPAVQAEMEVAGGAAVPISFVPAVGGIMKGSTFKETAFTIPNDKTTILKPQSGNADLRARVWDFNVANQQVGNECAQIPIKEDGILAIDMARIDCPGFVRQGNLIEVRSGSQAAYFVMNNRVAPQVGDDLGIALTLVDRWDDRDSDGNGIDEGSRVNSGTSFYYSVSNLKTDIARLIGNVSLLNGDPEIDLEIGLGLGVLLRTSPLAGTGTGFGIAAGIGYNLMLDDPGQRWYTFVGFSMNFSQQGGSK